MQFRKITDTNKVQCLVAHYDTETKRTRQKLLCTLDMTNPIISGDHMSRYFSFGSKEEKEGYISEIDTYIDQYRVDHAPEIASLFKTEIAIHCISLNRLLENSSNALSREDRLELSLRLEHFAEFLTSK
ncbi:hypothetical protein GJU93_02035 [Brucella sp. 10RB9212]|uniref:hypothetical protein n=1 Tax=unclassified Brucella TaxID=2632610 RepID=UPI0012AD9753|nr:MULTISPECIES: hypothetical protein [unclassified Brucella]MRN45385.1 hypothetical protein [Brucella sp. 10RB9212]